MANSLEKMSIAGDLEEEYQTIAGERGIVAAWFWYLWQILILIPTFILSSFYWSREMIKNYLMIALRNIRRHKIFSFINIAGLAVGMACFLLILLIAYDQLTYDRFHEKKDRIFRLQKSYVVEGNTFLTSRTPAPLGPALKNDLPEVTDYVRIVNYTTSVSNEDRSFVERSLCLADPSFFEVFSFSLIRGNPTTVLQKPNSVVLTEETAEKYFGKQDPIGRTITINEKFDFEVTGIAKNSPYNSHLDFDLVVPFEHINTLSRSDYLNYWGASNFWTYLLLQKDIPAPGFGEKIRDILIRYRGKEAGSEKLYLQPLTKINLELGNKYMYIYFLTTIAAFILLLACINFTNLSLAQSSARAKEVGLRKVIGANRAQLVKQFLGESIVISLVALPLTIFLIEIALPFLNNLTNTQMRIDYFQNWYYLLFFLGVTLLVSIVSGSYPALYMSLIQPANTLKGIFRLRKSVFRNGLIIFQFSISVFLIIGTLTIHNQLNYMRTTDLGFNEENLLNVSIHYSLGVKQQIETVKNELLRLPGVAHVSVSNFFPGGSTYNNSVWWEEKKENEEMSMKWISVDHDFLKTYQIELARGRDYSKAIQSDVKTAYLLNETAVKKLGWENPVGKQFQIHKTGNPRGTVIGVIKDFHFTSLRDRMRPLALHIDPGFFDFLSIRLVSDNIPATLELIENKLKEFAPLAPFEYWFADSMIDRMYTLEKVIGGLFNAFSLLAVFIACLGLLGLSSFAITQRTKEIGIRKVLGASASKIIVLLSREFARLVLIANVIAWPVAYFLMNKWLQNYPYRTNISIWIFILTGLTTFFIAFFTISFKAVRAALSNPVDVIKYE